MQTFNITSTLNF